MTAPQARTTADIETPNLSILYLGPPKSGKTTCALSWPDPLVLYLEENQAGLVGSHDLSYLTIEDMKPEPITSLQQVILPTIANGKIAEIVGDRTIRTIVIDSLTELFGTHMSKAVRGGKDALKGFDDYANFLYRCENFLVGSIGPVVRAGFNVVCTCHLGQTGGEPIMQKDNRDRWVEVGQGPIFRRPAIPGRFRDLICSRFDSVLLTGSVNTAHKVDGKLTGLQAKSYFVETINPDRTYEGIGDGLGKEGGRFKPLPPKLDGRYPALVKAWGFPSE